MRNLDDFTICVLAVVIFAIVLTICLTLGNVVEISYENFTCRTGASMAWEDSPQINDCMVAFALIYPYNVTKVVQKNAD